MEITADFVCKMILSAVLGAVFGMERAKHGQAAGIRTNMKMPSNNLKPKSVMKKSATRRTKRK
jgi:hypothetical protein